MQIVVRYYGVWRWLDDRRRCLRAMTIRVIDDARQSTRSVHVGVTFARTIMR